MSSLVSEDWLQGCNERGVGVSDVDQIVKALNSWLRNLCFIAWVNEEILSIYDRFALFGED